MEEQSNTEESTPDAPMQQNVYKVNDVDEPKMPQLPKSTFKPRSKKTVVIAALCLVALVAAVVIYLLVRNREIEWFSNPMLALYIAVGVVGGGIAACLMLRKTLRTRLRVEKDVREDPDINDWLIVFDWTPKILYVPTIIASFVAALITWIFSSHSLGFIGGIWFVIFLLNFIIEEYNISIKVLIIGLVGIGFFLLWLHLLDYVGGFLSLFREIAVSINATVYLLAGIVGLLAVCISWIKGLFYYVTMTPNYMNIQEGPTESGEQIGREDYNSRVDTSDFLERLMGFGRIIITFKDKKREPIILLVWRIQKKAQLLEKVRAKFAIDHIRAQQYEE